MHVGYNPYQTINVSWMDTVIDRHKDDDTKADLEAMILLLSMALRSLVYISELQECTSQGLGKTPLSLEYRWGSSLAHARATLEEIEKLSRELFLIRFEPL